MPLEESDRYAACKRIVEQNTQMISAVIPSSSLQNSNWGLYIQLYIYHRFTRCIRLPSRFSKSCLFFSPITSFTFFIASVVQSHSKRYNTNMKHNINTCSITKENITFVDICTHILTKTVSTRMPNAIKFEILSDFLLLPSEGRMKPM
ncbi:hypothetical protein Sjap_008947 [Stephania japonica]|uniref:Uncharacterized protein n=1 Tax=Stephania japonica TaxID=461633 RepID=A0AAP0PBC0_9MAGN